MKFVKVSVLILAGFLVVADCVVAEEDQWGAFGQKYQAIAGVNITQNSYDNWAAGGVDALAYALTLNGKLEKNQPGYIWTVTNDMAFGQTKQGEDEIRKAVDRISLEGVYTHKLGTFVNPYASLRFDTQFAKGYQYSDSTKTAVSNFIDPLYIQAGLGAGFFLRPDLTTRLGLGFKETMADQYAALYSDDLETDPKIEKSRFETGIESVTDYKVKLSEILLYETKLGLFSAFDHVDVVDVKWDNKWTAQVAKYVNVNLNVLVYYDEDIIKKTQINEALAIGLTYTLF